MSNEEPNKEELEEVDVPSNADSEQADLPSWLSAMERAFQAFERAVEMSDQQKGPSDELPSAAPIAQEDEIVPAQDDVADEDAPPPLPHEPEEAEDFTAKLCAVTDELKDLQEDIQRLFRFGDITGALVSLERMVLLSNDDPSVNSFLQRNHDQLISVFERVFDGFHQKIEPTRNVVPLGPDFRAHPTVQAVWNAVGNSSDLKGVLESVDNNDVATAAVLHHLLRCRRLQFFD